ncbi:winged helix-turn-helix transcriptional regulator [Lactobacillus corticis]|uniref:MarR family transcriptional regulator n=1 Tax=Lactobacillus corticis TaxID=2201249 RepID=A0A916QL40_9LACO|nr:helix-turn-helix domain-containing protein [Lactobacillus corticis]GFZ27531.1 MarR family transcriptional regulator [Lactobacillus corticis]
MANQLPSCPIATAIILVGDKWKIQIMRELLRDRPASKHYSDFKHAIPEISDKMLSKSLKALESDHLLKRQISTTTPLRSTYTLTPMGADLTKVVAALKTWGTKYKKEFEEK